MKNLILVSAVLLAMTACSSDDSNSTGGNGNEYSCNVSRNANTVVMDLKYKAFGELRTVTFDSHGENPYYTVKRTFPTETYAQGECQEEKDEDYYKRRCAKYDEEYGNGSLAKKYDKTFGG